MGKWRHWNMTVAVAMWAGLSGLIGCGPQAPPEQRAVTRAMNLRSAALELATQAMLAAAPYQLEARFNPVDPGRCDCPRFEVKWGGSWQRVYLVSSDDELLPELDRRVPPGSAFPTFFTFVGTPTDEVRRAGEEGQLFGVFEVERFEAITP